MRYLVILLFIFCQFSFVYNKKTKKITNIPSRERVWADSVYNQMSFEEKVGQLFMVAAYSNKDFGHIRSIDNLIREYKVGGIIFFQGGPYRQANLTNRFQSESKLPLFIGLDAEWGINMRLDSTYRYPWNMTLGAIQDMKLIEKLGSHMGQESKRMGVHFNFAPVLDINTNPKNPIIGNRSFGENKIYVAERALALMNGIQGQGVYATGKHFPGHGNTETDSHYSLPFVKLSRERIEGVELYPYKLLFEQGLASVMVAHLDVPGLGGARGVPSSLSYDIITKLLKQKLNFQGLIFTDALNMKAVNKYKKPGEVDLQAFLAGNDILLFTEKVPIVVEKFKEAYNKGIITEERLRFSVKKILEYKFRIGLDRYKPIEIDNLFQDLNKAENEALQYELFDNAITVLKNKSNILPIKELNKEKIAYIKLGDDTNKDFLKTLRSYTEITEVTDDNLDSLQSKLKKFTTVIIGYHKSDASPWKNHDFELKEITKLYAIAQNKKVILDIFANPYALLSIKKHQNIEGLIVSYQNNNISQNVSAQLIFGAIEAKGKLPVTINDFELNSGLKTKQLNRLGFTSPENVDMNSIILSKIDSIAENTIDRGIVPGMQILLARKGKVFYQKSFGYHTYSKDFPVKDTDIYDLASLTKIVSTLPNIMQLTDRGKLSINTKLGDMLPLFKTTDKRNITLKEMLSHNAGFQAWIPFYKETLDSVNKPNTVIYRKNYSSEFPYKVADDLYINKDYPGKIIKIIAESKLSKSKSYKYSDFPFIILKAYLEKESGKTLDILSNENFYKLLGANNTLYNPLRKFSIDIIPPTEIDNYFRYQTIQGYVHDMTAAMEGGVGGHAGVFSNALDVAKIMQMYLQKGNYGGYRFFSASTFEAFNSVYYSDNRRALGFDKPQKEKNGLTCDYVSVQSFGHSGFTGTYAWADPETEIIYVFLSNRTFPIAENNCLAKEDTRVKIQQIIKDAIVQ